jgi:hypothetical protein
LDGRSCQESGNQGSKLNEKVWGASCLVLGLVQDYDPYLLFWSARHLSFQSISQATSRNNFKLCSRSAPKAIELLLEVSPSKLLYEAELPRRDSVVLSAEVGGTSVNGMPCEGSCFSSGV